MDVVEKTNLLTELLEVDASEIDADTELNSIPTWDSMAALSLIALLEEYFSRSDIDGRQISKMKKIEDIFKVMEKQMSNLEKYQSIFKESFQYAGDVEDLEYQAIAEWDSIGHMQLMAALEDSFSIELDVDDIIDFSSFKKGIKILTKYNVIM